MELVILSGLHLVSDMSTWFCHNANHHHISSRENFQ